MVKNKAKQLLPEHSKELIGILKTRFENNKKRHTEIAWSAIESRLFTNNEKLWSLNEMEKTGGEPDVVSYDKEADVYVFMDCAAESPKGRRSLCYDREGLDSRKEHKPKNNAQDMAADMGITLLSEKEYRELQMLGKFDLKTSSWISTPANIRSLGGALFADNRYDTVFVYHNGASSYYAARGFRGSLKI